MYVTYGWKQNENTFISTTTIAVHWSILRETKDSNVGAYECGTFPKSHWNLMHLKRKIYFSILMVVNFKINMVMCFVDATQPFCIILHPNDRSSKSIFSRLWLLDVSTYISNLKLFNVTMDAKMLEFDFRLPYPFNISTATWHRGKQKRNYYYLQRSAAAIFFSLVTLCQTLFVVER